MKASPLSIPSRDNDAADPVAFPRQRVLQNALDEVYFEMVLAPGYGGEGPAIGVAVEHRYFVLPAGAVTPIHSHRPIRNLWPRTRLRVTVWGWTDGGAPGTFTLRLNIAQISDGMGVGGPAYPVFNHDFALAPGVPNVQKKVVTTAPALGVIGAGELVKVYLARLNDGNANGLYLTCARIEFLEVA